MPEDEIEVVSKTALKKQMTALQELGEELVSLSDKELSRIPIEDESLGLAIAEARAIRSNSARKRHLQYIGKVMRNIDAEPIAKALAGLHQQRQGDADAFHELEALRDKLLGEGVGAIEAVLEVYPQADRQHLRQLVRQAAKEQSQSKPPVSARKLFKYLRELSEQTD